MSTPEEAAQRQERAGPSAATLAEAGEILDKAELVNVRPIEMSARSLELPGRAVNVGVQTTIEFSVGAGMMANRIHYQIDLLGQGDEPLAEITFTLQVEYDVEPDYVPTQDGAGFIAGTTGLFAAYPYARELAQNLTTRLQHDALVLGLLPRGAGEARAVTQVAHRGQ